MKKPDNGESRAFSRHCKELASNTMNKKIAKQKLKSNRETPHWYCAYSEYSGAVFGEFTHELIEFRDFELAEAGELRLENSRMNFFKNGDEICY